MIKHRFRPDKGFSQNFIVDKNIIDLLIFHAKLKKSDVVLEIGPGLGFLTEELVKHCKVVAVEADTKMASILVERVKSDNLQIINSDFLKADLPKFNKVVSLPPYSISSDLVYSLMEKGFESATLVFQKEFAEKISSYPGFPDYGPIAVVTNYYCEPKILVESIAPLSFFPQPKSFSSLINLKYKKRYGSVHDEKVFLDFVSSIFRYKNKNLRNALSNSYMHIAKKLTFSKEEFLAKADSLKLSDKKVNLIEVSDYVKMFNEFFAEK